MPLPDAPARSSSHGTGGTSSADCSDRAVRHRAGSARCDRPPTPAHHRHGRAALPGALALACGARRCRSHAAQRSHAAGRADAHTLDDARHRSARRLPADSLGSCMVLVLDVALRLQYKKPDGESAGQCPLAMRLWLSYHAPHRQSIARTAVRTLHCEPAIFIHECPYDNRVDITMLSLFS